MSSPRIQIAIIGGGPVGFAAARLIQCQDAEKRFQVTVYDLESGTDARWQGSSIDLRPNTGLKVIAEAGLNEQFYAKARVEGEEMRFCNHKGEVLLEHTPFLKGSTQKARGNPEISRGDLRDVLMNSLEPDTIKWAHKLSHVSTSTTSPGKHIAHFTNGTQVEADLIVGADGAWSKTRNFLSDQKPVYTGLTFQSNKIKDPWSKVPETMKLVGQGLCFFLKDGRIYAHLQLADPTEVTLLVSAREPESFFQPGGFFSPEVAADPARGRGAIKEMLKDFSPLLTDVVEHLEGPFWSGGLYSMPDDFAFPTTIGVTLVGDSAHVTVPHAGEGLNTGLIDSAELARTLVAYDPSTSRNFHDYLSKAQPRFEAVMMERAHKLIQRSLGNTNNIFKNEDVNAGVEYVREALKKPFIPPELSTGPATAAVPAH
ncbi:hypothetical protein OC846_006373 [Tilletia horrida]|uniref:FAD-binding domain-containing protein n=1 Tax=Tilletia horrida TaxID=155126 RepID=A0AAN6JQQ2_9BASI|nr:hypothetical protein OC846_006373 [Tilletia horrida]KAK0565867.1 hypothetical protein OC861_003528 [Tilletia horrida]